jgi:hypothetical protein
MRATIIGLGSSSRLLSDTMGLLRNRRRADVAIAYGYKGKSRERLNSGRYPIIINRPEAVEKSSNKHKSLEIMREAGIRVPNYNRVGGLLKLPILGRDFYHTKGSDIRYFETMGDVTPCDYYVEFLPIEKERRYHVIGDKVVSATFKQNGSREGRGWYCRNTTTGWTFKTYTPEPELSEIAVKAVKAFGLDFGAVDIIISGGVPYVLEVNTAPGLCPIRADIYAKELNEYISMI